MAKINGVLGEIDSADLGFTLMHEHIMVASWAMRQAFRDWATHDAIVEEAVQQVRAAKRSGVETIVDATPISLGRDVDVMREVAERAEMHIIAATGLYWYEPFWLQGGELDRLVEFFVRDVESGIQGTTTRAGIIKAGTGPSGVTPANRKSLQLAARVQLATGVPITTHTSAELGTGLTQQDVFEEEGVDLRRVVIGHCGDTDDIEYLEKLLRRGSFIGMDRFGTDTPLSTGKRISTIAELCRRGWTDRMVLSHDVCCFVDVGPMEAFRASVPNWHFCFIPDDVVPMLRQAGVNGEQISMMTVTTPARILGG